MENHSETRGFFENAVVRWAGTLRLLLCTPKGIRTPVAGLKGLSPSPLDDGGVLEAGTRVSVSELTATGQISRQSESFHDNWILYREHILGGEGHDHFFDS